MISRNILNYNNIFRLGFCYAMIFVIPIVDSSSNVLSQEKTSVSKENNSPRNPGGGLTAEQISQLEALGYLSGYVPPPEKTNVTIYNKEKAYDGLNFFSSPHKPSAYIVDMQGNTLHEWSRNIDEVWPEKNFDGVEHTKFWRRVYLYPNGDLLAIFENIGIVKLDKDSNILWKNDNRAHHDLEVLENGDIWVLTNKLNSIPRIAGDVPVQEDYLTLMDQNGKILKEISLLASIENSEFQSIMKRQMNFKNPEKQPAFDIFHTNTLEVLDGRVEHILPEFRKGNILTSFRTLDAIAVVDQKSGLAVWVYQERFRGQHDPKVLESGNMLLFDNFGSGEASIVLEYGLENMDVVWSYSGTSESPFYSIGSGTAQRLLNGNTLITETQQGRAFEVTREKEIVWEFFNPNLVGANKELIAAIWEMIRIEKTYSLNWINNNARHP